MIEVKVANGNSMSTVEREFYAVFPFLQVTRSLSYYRTFKSVVLAVTKAASLAPIFPVMNLQSSNLPGFIDTNCPLPCLVTPESSLISACQTILG